MENISISSKKRKSLVFINNTIEVFNKDEVGGLQDIKKNKADEEVEDTDKDIYGTCEKINNYAKINRIGEGIIIVIFDYNIFDYFIYLF